MTAARPGLPPRGAEEGNPANFVRLDHTAVQAATTSERQKPYSGADGAHQEKGLVEGRHATYDDGYREAVVWTTDRR